MESFQQTTRNEDQDMDEGNTHWPNNSYHTNFQITDNSINENNPEHYSNSYDLEHNNRHMESQNIPDNRNFTGQVDDTASVDFGGSNVVSGIQEMGRDCLEVEHEINQKYNDIELLVEDAKVLKLNIEEKKKILESAKVELLTEQDNFDDIQRQLNDEIELITAIGNQQEALNKQTKNLFEQKIRVNQHLENFSTEFSATKVSGENLFYVFEEKNEELNTILKTLADTKKNIGNKKLTYFSNKQNIEENVTSKINKMKLMLENLKVKYVQQVAILDYLKSKSNEEKSRCKEFESVLSSEQEKEQHQIHLKECTSSALEERINETNEKLIQFQQENEKLKICKQKLINRKTQAQEDVKDLLQKRHDFMERLQNKKASLLKITTEAEQLNQRLDTKDSTIEKKYNLDQVLDALKQKKADLSCNKSEVSNLIIEANKRCNDLEINLADASQEINILVEIRNSTDLKRLSLFKCLEEIKDEHKNSIEQLEKQKCVYYADNITLENQIVEQRNEIDSITHTVENESREILNLKECFQKNDERICLIKNKIEAVKQEIVLMQNQFEIDMSALKKKTQEREIIKEDVSNEIRRRQNLQLEIESLKGELLVLDSDNRNEMTALKEQCQSELEQRQAELENKKAQLELMNQEKKKKVADLQEDIVDEQKNELHLIKAIQKLTFIHDKNKRELKTLQNVIKTLEEKLYQIVKAVTHPVKDTTIQTQSTVLVSGSMGPPGNKTNPTKDENLNDSSSSGVSIHDNTAWKNRFLKKQQMKRQNTPSTMPSTSSQQEPRNETKTTVEKPSENRKQNDPRKNRQLSAKQRVKTSTKNPEK